MQSTLVNIGTDQIIWNFVNRIFFEKFLYFYRVQV